MINMDNIDRNIHKKNLKVIVTTCFTINKSEIDKLIIKFQCGNYTVNLWDNYYPKDYTLGPYRLEVQIIYKLLEKNRNKKH